MSNPNVVSVGRFTYDKATGELAGPAEYMKEKGWALLDEIMAGDNVLFNYACTRNPSTEVSILVTLQTDYAGWRGLQQILNMGKRRK